MLELWGNEGENEMQMKCLVVTIDSQSQIWEVYFLLLLNQITKVHWT